MDDREKLVQLKYNAAFESIQKNLQAQREEAAERLGASGMGDSGFHVREIIALEVNSLRSLLEAKLAALMESYFKSSPPYTDEDLSFLREEIRKLYGARRAVSMGSLAEYLNRRRLRYSIQDFERDADSVFANVMRNIEIKVLENRILSPKLPDLNIEQLLKMDESNQLEFKSTFQWDIKKQIKNKDLRFEIASTLAAFSNTDGGYLLIGVQDNRRIFGLETDYSLLRDKQNWDGFCLTLTQDIENKVIPKDFVTKLKISQHTIENKDICLIKTDIGEDATWLIENSTEVFYIRTQNSTRALSTRDSAEYIRKKWPCKVSK